MLEPEMEVVPSTFWIMSIRYMLLSKLCDLDTSVMCILIIFFLSCLFKNQSNFKILSWLYLIKINEIWKVGDVHLTTNRWEIPFIKNELENRQTH